MVFEDSLLPAACVLEQQETHLGLRVNIKKTASDEELEQPLRQTKVSEVI